MLKKLRLIRLFPVLHLVAMMPGLSFGQSVTDVRVDTSGTVVRIAYRIAGSGPSQLYHVTLFSSIGGMERMEPESVWGEVGHGIQGGGGEHVMFWDSEKDLNSDAERRGRMEFFVEAVMERDLDQVTSPLPLSAGQPYRVVVPGEVTTPDGLPGSRDPAFSRSAFTAYNGSLSNPFGISIGMLRRWGFYSSFRFGATEGDLEREVRFTAAAGVTRVILGNDLVRLHGYAGPGLGVERVEDRMDNPVRQSSDAAFEAGLTGVVGVLNLTLGMSYQGHSGADLVFGFGFVF